MNAQSEAPVPTPTSSDSTSVVDPVFSYAEIMPAYPGGDEQMQKDINGAIRYPEKERDAKISGKVFVDFVVEKDGSVKDIIVRKGIEGYPAFGDAAVAAVQKLKRFTPGENNGEKVRVKIFVPICFWVK
jgi:periplasmic protein TonB